MVYIDLLVIEDFLINYIILLVLGIILNREVKFKRLFLSSAIGVIPLALLFLELSNQSIFIINIVFSAIMVIIAFKYQSIIYTIKNIIYMYIISVSLSGTIYMLKVSLPLDTKNHLINCLFLIATIVATSYIYTKSIINLKNNYSNYYKVDIYFKDKPKITLTAYLDTGNKLFDPYTYLPIILVAKDYLPSTKQTPILVPYNTIDSSNLLKCIKPEKIFIDKVGYRKKVLIGIIDNVMLEGAECILNSKLLERI